MSPETEPPFPPLKKTQEEKRAIWRQNMAKAHQASRAKAKERQRIRSKWGDIRNRHLTVEEAHELLREELMTVDMVISMARVLKRQAREGSQAQRYRAALDWRDQFLGKPTLVKSDEEIAPPTIVIESPIFARIAAADRDEDAERD